MTTETKRESGIDMSTEAMRMARLASLSRSLRKEDEAAKIAKAVLAEREACAKLADAIQDDMRDECNFGAGLVAAAIRARGD